MVRAPELPVKDTRPHVVIVGGGFGGLYAARGLARAPVRVTLVDRRNHHLFQPLLYQVATAALAAPSVASPIRQVLRRQQNTTVLLAEVVDIDVARRRVALRDGGLDYDYLILAAGASSNYFGHADWEAHAPGLKSIEDAFEIRRRVLLAFEAAERSADPAEQRHLLSFVVIGAGATGVELAGALSEIARRTLTRDFRRFDPADARVILVDAGPRVLPEMPPRLSEAARGMLERLGVEVRTGQAVTGVDAGGVELGDERIEASVVLWAAGVTASPLARALGAPLDRQGRVRVGPDLAVPGHPEIFVVGDMAAVEQDGSAVPGMAPGAIQGGRHAAGAIAAEQAGQPRRPFRYRDRGALATVGRRAAVARLGRIQSAGLAAWLLWVGVHIAFLIGFRNRIAVLFEWAWAYFTWQRGARVIVTGVPETGGGPAGPRSPGPAALEPGARSGPDTDRSPG